MWLDGIEKGWPRLSLKVSWQQLTLAKGESQMTLGMKNVKKIFSPQGI